VLYCHLYSVWVYHVFPHYFTNGTIFGGGGGGGGGEVIKHKMYVLIFSITFARNVSHIIINLYPSSCEVQSVLSLINEPWTFWTDFWKTFMYQISWKPAQCEPSCSMLTDRQASQSKLTFRYFANAPNNSTFRPHSVFMCFVWIWEQTAIISLHSINLTGFYNRNGVCLLRGTDWIFTYNDKLT